MPNVTRPPITPRSPTDPTEKHPSGYGRIQWTHREKAPLCPGQIITRLPSRVFHFSRLATLVERARRYRIYTYESTYVLQGSPPAHPPARADVTFSRFPQSGGGFSVMAMQVSPPPVPLLALCPFFFVLLFLCHLLSPHFNLPRSGPPRYGPWKIWLAIYSLPACPR